MLSASTQHRRLKGRPDSILWDSCGSNAQFGTHPREAPYTLSCLAKPSEGPWQARGAWGVSVTGMAGPSVQSSVPWQGHRDLFPARHSAGLSEPQQVPYPCRLGRPGVCCVSLSASYFCGVQLNFLTAVDVRISILPTVGRKEQIRGLDNVIGRNIHI